MTDDELIRFLGIDQDEFTDPEHKARFLAQVAPHRALYEHMALADLYARCERGLDQRSHATPIEMTRRQHDLR